MTPRYRSALVTGGSTGIGASIVRRLAQQGTKVAVAARSKDALDAIVAEVGAGAFAIPADLSDPRRAAAVVHEAEQRLDGLDLVIANAGTGLNRPGAKLELEHILGIFELNILGAAATITAAIPAMVARGSGHLVGISSIAANRGLPTAAAYCASKAALSIFLESLRVDLAAAGIAVTDIRPGFVDTPLTKKNKFKMPFLLGADDAADRIMRAIERRRRVYTFPLPMAVATWFLRRLPNAVFDRLASRGFV